MVMVVNIVKEISVDLHTGDDLALCEAVGSGEIALVDFFLDNHAKVNTGDGWSLLIAASKGDIKMVLHLIEKGAALHVDKTLRYAAGGGNTALVDYFTSKGANVDASFYGHTPFSEAASKGDTAMAMLLIQKRDADLEMHGDHVLCQAVGNGNVGLVAYLLSKGAIVDARDGVPS